MDDQYNTSAMMSEISIISGIVDNGESGLLTDAGEIYDNLSGISTEHDSCFSGCLSFLDENDRSSLLYQFKSANSLLDSLLQRLNDNYNTIVSVNSGGSVGTGGISGGVGTSGGGSLAGDYTVDAYTPTDAPELGSYTGSDTTPYIDSSSSKMPTETPTIPTTSYRDTLTGGGTSGGSIHTGASIGGVASALASAVGGLGGASDNVLPQVEYPLGNYSVNGAFINDLDKEVLKEKLVDVGFTGEEIEAVMNGEYDVSKVLVDKISEKLAEAYQADSGVREYLIDEYGFDIFNEDGTVNNDRLSLALYMDDKNGLDSYSIINTLNEKYGISVVDQVTMKSYIGQFESMFMKDSKIRDKFKEEYGFDVFNADGTVNKDRLTLAMLIDEKSNGKYSIEKFIKEAESSALVNSLGNDVTKIAGGRKESGSKLPYIAGAAAVGAAAVGSGIAINKKKQEEDEDHEGKNRFITDLDFNEKKDDSDYWLQEIIKDEITKNN